MKVTIFNTLYDKKPQYSEVSEIFKKIKTSERLKTLTEKVRELDSESRAEAKKELPICLFAGTFLERKNSAIESYSKLVILDFDKLEDKYGLYKQLTENPNTMAVWESPSGTGLKAVFLVSSEDYSGHVKALLAEWPLADKLKDVARATYLSFDPEIFTKQAVPYTKVIKDAHTDKQKYDNLKKWLENKGDKFINGQRNSFIAKLAGAMNRFGVSADFAKSVVITDFCGGDFSQREACAVIDSIYNRYPEQHGLESFENPITEEKQDEILSASVEIKDIITLEDAREALLEDYDVGIPGGGTTYFPELDQNFRWMKGEVTVLTGQSGMGKTTMLNQLLLIKAVKEGQKFGFLSLEQYPPVYFYRELIRSYIGKPLERERKDRMTRQEYERGMEFVKEHFFYVYPENDEPTPEYTQARFMELIIKYGIDGVITDPYSSQTHDFSGSNGRDDKYIAQMLNKKQRFALQNDVYEITVAHPKNIGKNDDGTYKEPTADSISGGVTWWQRSDNVLCFHRPFVPLDYTDPTCTFGSLKIKKQPLNGRPGKQEFTYDYWKGRYYLNNFSPLDK